MPHMGDISKSSDFSNIFSNNDTSKKPLSLLTEPIDSSQLSSALMSSFISDSTRGAMDLIQADFPSTPSSIFSNRLLDQDADFKMVSSLTEEISHLSTSVNSTTNTEPPSPTRISPLVNSGMSSLIGSKSASESDLDPTSKSFHYIPSLFNQVSNSTTGSNNSTSEAPGLSTSSTTSDSMISNFTSNENVNSFLVPPTSNNLTGILGANQTPPPPVPQPVSSIPIPTPQKINSSSQIPPPQVSMQPSFYVQPPIFMSPNGQPVFFRGQDFLYSSLDSNGMTMAPPPLVTAVPGDPSSTVPGVHLSATPLTAAPFIPYGAMANLPTNYWQTSVGAASADGSVQPNGTIPIFMNPQNPLRINMNPPAAGEDSNRILFPYGNTIPVGLTPSHPISQQPVLNSAAMPFQLSSGMLPLTNQPPTPIITPSHINLDFRPQQIPPPSSTVSSTTTPAASTPTATSATSSSSSSSTSSTTLNDIPISQSSSQSSPTLSTTSSRKFESLDSTSGKSSSLDRKNSDHSSSNYKDYNTGRRAGNRNNYHSNSSLSNNNRDSSNSLAGANPARDSLVEEFRLTFGKTKTWTLKDLTNHIVAFCQDQHGSRFIQLKLEISSEAEKQLVFDEVYGSAQTLMTDVFGNYVLQKLFEYGSPHHCEALANLLKGQAVQLSMQMYGCRVVQKALEYVSTEQLLELVSEFENPSLLFRCVHDSNGNHVIQKCIEVVSKAAKNATGEVSAYLSSRIQFIIDAFKGHVKELSSHPYGCRVVQRILEYCTNVQKAVVLEELRACFSDLVQDCYGNYVIQFVMEHGWDSDRSVLIKEVQTNLLDFSQHKFASNVVEKCLQYANKKDRDEIIWAIINVTFDLNNPVDSKGHCVLESMVRDPYANYVVQKVIDVSDEKQRGAIMRYVRDNIQQLRKYTYGKHIIVRLEKITNEKF